MEGTLEVLNSLQPVGIDHQTLSHGGVEHDVSTGDGVGRTYHTELKFIAGEGEGGGAVAVGGVPTELGQYVHPQLHLSGVDAGIGGVVLDAAQDGGQLIPQEHGHHGGRRLVGPQAVVVSSGGYRHTQQVLVVVHCLDDGAEEQQELGILIGRFTGGQQIDTGVSRQRPVVVLA